MKTSIHRNKLRFVLYIKLICTWSKICILICCVCVNVRFQYKRNTANSLLLYIITNRCTREIRGALSCQRMLAFLYCSTMNRQGTLLCCVDIQCCWSATWSPFFRVQRLAASSRDCYTSSLTCETSTRNIRSSCSRSTLSEFSLLWRRFLTLIADRSTPPHHWSLTVGHNSA